MYINNSELKEQLLNYVKIKELVGQRATKQRRKRLAVAGDALARSVMLIARGFNSRYKILKDDADEDDFVQDAVITLLAKAQRFDPEKGRAFNYVTTILHNLALCNSRTGSNYEKLKHSFFREQGLKE